MQNKLRAKILLIDNYDSFTYNLVSLLEQNCGYAPDVWKNDEVEIASVNLYDAIVLSPGPGIPREAGKLLEVLKIAKKPVLGVCLGHQAIAENFGAELWNPSEVFHGISTNIFHNNSFLFEGLPSPFKAGRYHSWLVREETLPETLVVTARDEAGNVMAIEHTTQKKCGVQFHPESIMTPEGSLIINNWLRQV